MSTYFDGDSYIDSDVVVSRIADLESELEDEQLFQVISVASGDSLGNFDSEEDAEQFIADEDYVRERVRISESDSEVDQDELSELRQFSEEGESEFGYSTWKSGIRLTRADIINEDFARDRAEDQGVSWSSELDGYINWKEYAEDLTDGEKYATLNGDQYYNL